jgi:S1-C subfamily serine protease
MNLVLNVATNLIDTGEVQRGMLGLFPANLDRDMAEAFGLESTRGALVNQVQESSPAERAGIKHGDVILKVDEIEIDSAQQLRLEVSQMMPGREVIVKLVRQDEILDIPVVLGSLSGEPVSSVDAEGDIRGVMMRALNAEIRENFSIPDDVEGVFVVEVENDSPFADRLERLMVILEVNGRAVESPGAVEAALVEGHNRLYVWNGGAKRFIVMKL